MKVWIENGNIFMTDDETVAPENAVDVPDNVTIQDLKVVDGTIQLKTEEEKKNELITLIKSNIITKARQKILSAIQDKGYYDIGDLKLYADKKEPEAVETLNWYKEVDRKIWKSIEDLHNKTLQELKEFNIDKELEVIINGN